jgi:lipoate-protein ligase A
MEARPFSGEAPRVLDTGLRPAAQNIALSRALLEARHAGEIPDTLRFLRHTPSALLGNRQSAEQEFEAARCRAAGVAIQRRLTHGAAVLVAERDLGWELCLRRDATDPQAAVRRLCNAAAAGLAALGIEARLRAHHEIAVDGRKLADAAFAQEGDALLVEGIVRIECDYDLLARVTRTPADGDNAAAQAGLRERVTACAALLDRAPATAQVKALLVEAFESELACEFAEADLTLTEHARYQRALAEISTADWTDLVRDPRDDAPRGEAALKHAAGTLQARVLFDRASQRLKQVWFGGDVPVRPRSAVLDLEAWLAGAPLGRLEHLAGTFFASRPLDSALVPATFAAVVRAATQPVLLAR